MSFPSTIILDVYAGIGLSDRYSIQDGSPNMAWRRTEDTAQSTDVQNQLTLGEVDRVSKEAVNPFFWGLQPDDSNNSIVDVVKKAPTTKGLLRLGSLGRVQRALNLNGLTRDRFSELYSSPTVFPSHIKWTDVEDRKIKHLEGRFCTDGSIERPMKWRFDLNEQSLSKGETSNGKTMYIGNCGHGQSTEITEAYEPKHGPVFSEYFGPGAKVKKVTTASKGDKTIDREDLTVKKGDSQMKDTSQAE